MKKPYIGRDDEVRELDDAFFAKARRGRPLMAPETRKRRVNLMLDPDVAARLREMHNSSAYVNALLRKQLDPQPEGSQ